MFKSLYVKMVSALLLAFSLLLALAFTMDWMLSNEQLHKLIIELVEGTIIFTLAMGLIVFFLLTRRLRELANAIDAFRNSSFSTPVKLKASNPDGDEIDRLGFVFEQMAQRMIEQLQSIQTVDLQRRELLANISHDLRTPLASMRGYLETLLLKEGELTPEEQHHYLEVAAKQSERLSKMVGDLFQLTKLDANEVVINPENFPISELLQDIAQKFTLQAENKGVRIEVGFAESLPLVSADIGLIERVLENLIENALRYTASSGLIRLSLEHSQGGVSIAIADNGRGMDASQLDKIFDRYYRADRSKESDSGHAGLGLAIAQRVVMLHGSSIRVESQRGIGTRFSFELPVSGA